MPLDGDKNYDRIIRPLERRMMVTVWRILRDVHDSEDAFQDATLRIWQKWKQICRHPNPQAMVLRICINCAYDVLRRRRYDRDLSHTTEELASHAESVIDRLAQQEQRARILRAIGRLSRNQAVAVLMRLVERMSYADIADALGCQEATARVHCRRGRKKLQHYLSHGGNQ